MKNLQEHTLELNGSFPLSFIESGKSSGFKSVILLLHGLNERGLRIQRKLIDYLPTDALVLAPNAPFPLPRMKEERIDYGYTWYFFNKFKQSYDVDQGFAISLIQSLLKLKNPQDLPVTIIGFSQGGYLAPVLAKKLENTERVIGLGCEFRPVFFDGPVPYKLHALHGEKDEVIPLKMSQDCLPALKEKSIHVDYRVIPQTGHEISAQMGEAIREILNGK